MTAVKTAPSKPAEPFVSTQSPPLLSRQLRAFARVLRMACGTFGMGDQHGYDVLEMSQHECPHLMESFRDHPRKKIKTGFEGQTTTGAGAYALTEEIFDRYKLPLALQDFSPAAQDTIYVKMMQETHADRLLASDQLMLAVGAASLRWPQLLEMQPTTIQRIYAEALKS